MDKTSGEESGIKSGEKSDGASVETPDAKPDRASSDSSFGVSSEREAMPRLKRRDYRRQKQDLQVELLKVQRWVRDRREKICVLFEGRDAAGKGGAIRPFTEKLNPRSTRLVALQKPTEYELGQWYFQRYISELPSAGEIRLFDRSWYNRAGIEHVMGFCTPAEYLEFMRQTPEIERMLVRSGMHLFKYWFSISQRVQLERFDASTEDPLRRWNLSSLDHAAIKRWDKYTEARDAMFFHTHTADAPWVVIQAQDKRRARIHCLQHFLFHLDYPGKNHAVVTGPDPEVVGAPLAQLHC